jgi:hypothetical protein
MSNETSSTEKERKVVISPEDCNAALDFWRHFNIPISADLQGALDAFAADSSILNQDKVKLEVCKAIAITDHEAFKDDMFSKIKEECEGVTFEMQFDKDLEDTVTVKE